MRDSKLEKSDIEKIILVGGPTRMLVVQELVKGFMGKDIERGVDPMECVAMGAAIQAGVLGGESRPAAIGCTSTPWAMRLGAVTPS